MHAVAVPNAADALPLDTVLLPNAKLFAPLATEPEPPAIEPATQSVSFWVAQEVLEEPMTALPASVEVAEVEVAVKYGAAA